MEVALVRSSIGQSVEVKTPLADLIIDRSVNGGVASERWCSTLSLSLSLSLNLARCVKAVFVSPQHNISISLLCCLPSFS